MAQKKTPVERAKEFLDGVLAKVPEEQREAVRTAMSVDAILADIGNGVLRQDEFSRSMDELNRTVEAHTQWYERNKPIVDRANAIMERHPEGDSLIDDDPALDPGKERKVADPNALTKEQFDKALGETLATREQGAMLFMAKLSDLQARHYSAFGKFLDTSALVTNPDLYKVGLDGLYEQTYRDDYAKKAQAELDAKLAAAKEAGKQEGITEMQAKLAQTGPYPTPHAGAVVSPVMSALTEVVKDPAVAASRGFANRVDVNQAAAEYQQLVAGGAK